MINFSESSFSGWSSVACLQLRQQSSAVRAGQQLAQQLPQPKETRMIPTKMGTTIVKSKRTEYSAPEAAATHHNAIAVPNQTPMQEKGIKNVSFRAVLNTNETCNLLYNNRIQQS